MPRLVYYIGVSVDGYIAGPGGEFDFFPLGEGRAASDYMEWMSERFPETVPTHVLAQLGMPAVPPRRFGSVIMGAATYRIGLDAGVANPYASLRTYVVTLSISEPPDPAITLVTDPVAAVRGLTTGDDDGDVWLCGGGALAGALVDEIDELIVKSYPVIAGAGVPMIAGRFSPAAFDVAERTAFGNGVVVTRSVRREP